MNMPRNFRFAILRKGVLTALAAALFSAPLANAVELRLNANESKLLSLAGQPATIIVANPIVADVTMLSGKMVVQAHAPGKTEITVLDAQGQKLANLDVIISNDSDMSLRVYKAGSRVTYTCSPKCERTIVVGDDAASTTKLKNQLSAVMSAIKSSSNP